MFWSERGGGVLICALWEAESFWAWRGCDQNSHMSSALAGVLRLGWREGEAGDQARSFCRRTDVRWWGSGSGKSNGDVMVIWSQRWPQLTLWQSQAAAGDTSLLAFSHFLFPLLFLFILATLILHPIQTVILSKTCSSQTVFWRTWAEMSSFVATISILHLHNSS